MAGWIIAGLLAFQLPPPDNTELTRWLIDIEQQVWEAVQADADQITRDEVEELIEEAIEDLPEPITIEQLALYLLAGGGIMGGGGGALVNWLGGRRDSSTGGNPT